MNVQSVFDYSYGTGPLADDWDVDELMQNTKVVELLRNGEGLPLSSSVVRDGSSMTCSRRFACSTVVE